MKTRPTLSPAFKAEIARLMLEPHFKPVPFGAGSYSIYAMLWLLARTISSSKNAVYSVAEMEFAP